MAARTHKGVFTKVRVARELLRERAEDLLKEYLDVVKEARDAGDYEVAAKSLQWLIEHMPRDEDGGSVVDVSVDKQKQIEAKPAGPAIQIGIQLGGIGRSAIGPKKPEELQAPIEAEVIKEE